MNVIDNQENNKIYIHPKLFVENNPDLHLYVSHSICSLILRFCKDKSEIEIEDIIKNNNLIDHENKILNSLIEIGYSINQAKSTDFLNLLEDYQKSIKNEIKPKPIFIELEDINNNKSKEEVLMKQVLLENDENEKNYKKKEEKKINVKSNSKVHSTPKCPHCFKYVIIEGGCNFITCDSPYCNSAKYFCAVCGTKLNFGDKISHFPNGIANNSCKNFTNNFG